MPNLSIIIPVYNAELYIEQCIKSIIGISGNDYELILVNDGSTDGSAEICDKYAATNDRIKVIHINNSGASKARNIGLGIALGDYIWFIDADDWIENDFPLSLDWCNMPDIVFFGFIREFGSSEETCRISSIDKEYKGNIGEVLSELFNSANQYFGYTWNKIFKRSLITDNFIRFREDLIIKEDEVFTLEYCKHVKTLEILSATPYHYRVLQNSVSHCLQNKRNMYQLACFLDSEIDDPSYASDLKRSFKNAIFNYYQNAIFEKSKTVRIDSIIDKYIDFYNRNKDEIVLSGKNKILFRIPSNYLKLILIKIYTKISL